jgi:pimeloyl-ACP methyl ester carboxylesterase
MQTSIQRPETINGIPLQTEGLSEPASWSLLSTIQVKSIAFQAPLNTPSTPQLTTIATTYVQAGEDDDPRLTIGHRPILLLHGFDSSVMEYRRLLPQLSPDREIWAMDLFGFGFNQRPANVPVSPATIKAHLHGFWQTCIQRPMVLVGASMGGAAAIDFALSYPEAIASLILLDSAGWQDGGTMGRFLVPPLGYLATSFLANPKVRQRVSEQAYANPVYASPDAQVCARLHLASPGWRSALISFTRNGGYGSMRSHLGALTTPTTLVWGRQDRILGVRDTEAFYQALPNGTLHWVENCGHVPHLEQPEQTAEIIIQASK